MDRKQHRVVDHSDGAAHLHDFLLEVRNQRGLLELRVEHRVALLTNRHRCLHDSLECDDRPREEKLVLVALVGLKRQRLDRDQHALRDENIVADILECAGVLGVLGVLPIEHPPFQRPVEDEVRCQKVSDDVPAGVRLHEVGTHIEGDVVHFALYRHGRSIHGGVAREAVAGVEHNEEPRKRVEHPQIPERQRHHVERLFGVEALWIDLEQIVTPLALRAPDDAEEDDMNKPHEPEHGRLEDARERRAADVHQVGEDGGGVILLPDDELRKLVAAQLIHHCPLLLSRSDNSRPANLPAAYCSPGLTLSAPPICPLPSRGTTAPARRVVL
mmetsp:Transcript_37577/g.88070  ORF Transcript_37577/g.88070 Transcript_37577/m.88070 type:complete len:329 (-) Transcript_37577:25-1011(-)